ncbi:hypothetical protein [Methylobacterium variabile]|nr:hypothetical protein [Methylobacterium variabile]
MTAPLARAIGGLLLFALACQPADAQKGMAPTYKRIQITDPGSTGDASLFSVAPPGGAPRPLSTVTIPLDPAAIGFSPGLRTLLDAVAKRPATPSDRLFGSLPLTPYDYLPTAVQKTAVRTATGTVDAAPVFQAWLDDLVAQAGDGNIVADVPDGEWVFSRAARVYVRSPGKNRTLTLRMGRGAKFVAGPANQYRFLNKGAWDAAGNTLSDASGVSGDVWTAVSANDNLTGFAQVATVQVGDRIWKRPDGRYQKILATPLYDRQFWNAATGQDDAGNAPYASGGCDENRAFVVGRGGSYALDGITSWAIGDEGLCVQNAWRKLTIRGGTYRGTIDLATTVTNPSTFPLNNTSCTPGDWYTFVSPAGGPAGPTLVQLDSTHTTGFGDSSVLAPGDKVMCVGVGSGRWHKAYAGPTPRGRIRPSDFTINERRYLGAVSAGTPAGLVGPDVKDYPFESKGAFGAVYEIAEDFAYGGKTYLAGTSLYFGAKGLETIERDPDWDRGIFHFFVDQKSTVRLEGPLQVVSRIDGIATPELSNGIAVRVHSTERNTQPQGYLFQGSMFSAELYSESDVADPGYAQFRSGNWRKMIETLSIFGPEIRAGSTARTTQQGGAQRAASLIATPRAFEAAIDFIDSSVPVADLHANGAFGRAIGIFARGWDVMNTSIEGGRVHLVGAGLVDGVRVHMGFRQIGAYVPTVILRFGDVAANRYLARIQGRSGVVVDLGVPILADTLTSAPIVPKPALLYVEDCTDVQVNNGVPSGGSYTSAASYSSVIRTGGVVTGLTVRGLSLPVTFRGVVFDLAHNGNAALGDGTKLNLGPAYDPTVRVAPIGGYAGDVSGSQGGVKLSVGKAYLRDVLGPVAAAAAADFPTPGRVSVLPGGTKLVTVTTTVALGSDGKGTIAFPTGAVSGASPFTAPPLVIVQPAFNYVGGATQVSGTPTASGFQVVNGSVASQTVSVTYIAIGP